jgi:hypothetical protein
MKRLLSSLLLAALVAGAATPCRAAFMSCGMERPAPAVRCVSCDADGPSDANLAAGNCCRVHPGEVRDEAPALISTSATQTGPLKAESAAIVAAVSLDSGARSAHRALALPEATGPPSRSGPTTVLRL